MLARLATAALVGLTAHPVGVEVDIGRGLPAVTVVGLGGTAVLEARDRLRAAFGNTGYEWPDRRITVSLPPADLPKQGSGFDLPIAIGLLAAAGWVPPTALEGLWAIGELGLGGDVRAVKGVLPAALAARRSSARLLVVPQANLVEAALVPDLPVAGAASLGQVGEWLVGRADLGRPGPAARPPGAGGRGPRRHPRPAPGPPGPGDRRRRRPQPAPHRPARRRQDDAGQAPPRPAPAARAGRGARGHPGVLRRRAPRPGRRPHPRSGRSAPPTTPSRSPASSAAARSPDPARSPSPTTACCSSTSCRSSPGRPARRCANRSRRARSRSRGP